MTQSRRHDLHQNFAWAWGIEIEVLDHQRLCLRVRGRRSHRMQHGSSDLHIAHSPWTWNDCFPDGALSSARPHLPGPLAKSSSRVLPRGAPAGAAGTASTEPSAVRTRLLAVHPQASSRRPSSRRSNAVPSALAYRCNMASSQSASVLSGCRREWISLSRRASPELVTAASRWMIRTPGCRDAIGEFASRQPEVVVAHRSRDGPVRRLGPLDVRWCRRYVWFEPLRTARMGQYLVDASPDHGVAAQEQPHATTRRDAGFTHRVRARPALTNAPSAGLPSAVRRRIHRAGRQATGRSRQRPRGRRHQSAGTGNRARYRRPSPSARER